MELANLGRLLLLMGVGIFLLGGLFLLFSRVPILRQFGSLPGDISVRGENFACFVPIVSMCLLSLILTIVANVVIRLFAK